MRVYSQILFDLYISKTDMEFPETGSLPTNISELQLIPYESDTDLNGQEAEEVVKFMKNGLRNNSRDGRIVYVGKPHMDEKSNKVSLLEMNKSDVLGLETTTDDSRKDDSRTFYIRKPPLMSTDREDPYGLVDGDTIVLGFYTRISTDHPTEYYDLISEVTRVGTENMTIRTSGDIRKEAGIGAELLDFGVGGSQDPALEGVPGIRTGRRPQRDGG